MTLLLFALWILLNTLLFSLGIELGWGFDPGYVGPMLIVIVLHFTVALYSSKK